MLPSGMNDPSITMSAWLKLYRLLWFNQLELSFLFTNQVTFETFFFLKKELDSIFSDCFPATRQQGGLSLALTEDRSTSPETAK